MPPGIRCNAAHEDRQPRTTEQPGRCTAASVSFENLDPAEGRQNPMAAQTASVCAYNAPWFQCYRRGWIAWRGHVDAFLTCPDRDGKANPATRPNTTSGRIHPRSRWPGD